MEGPEINEQVSRLWRSKPADLKSSSEADSDCFKEPHRFVGSANTSALGNTDVLKKILKNDLLSHTRKLTSFKIQDLSLFMF